MPNNTINPYNLQPYQSPQQQGFAYVTTLINALFNSINYPVTNSLGSFLYYGTVAPATASIDVSDYNNHAFQAFLSSPTGSAAGNIFVSSSVDGLNWIGEFSFATSSLTSSLTTSSIFRLTGSRRHYFMATYYGSGPTTGSLYLLSGQ
jgi:hypothetical protein